MFDTSFSDEDDDGNAGPHPIICALAFGTVSLLEQRVLVEPRVVNTFLQTLWVCIENALSRSGVSRNEAVAIQVLHEYFSHNGVWSDQAACLRRQFEEHIDASTLADLTAAGAENFLAPFRTFTPELCPKPPSTQP